MSKLSLVPRMVQLMRSQFGGGELWQVRMLLGAELSCVAIAGITLQAVMRGCVAKGVWLEELLGMGGPCLKRVLEA